MVPVKVFQKLLIYWEFFSHLSVRLQIMIIKREHILSGSPVGENVLLMVQWSHTADVKNTTSKIQLSE